MGPLLDLNLTYRMQKIQVNGNMKWIKRMSYLWDSHETMILKFIFHVTFRCHWIHKLYSAISCTNSPHLIFSWLLNLVFSIAYLAKGLPNLYFSLLLANYAFLDLAINLRALQYFAALIAIISRWGGIFTSSYII